MSPDLLEQYRILHRSKKFLGLSLLPYASVIAEMVEKTGAETLLDYGCGAGFQYTKYRIHDAWGGIMPHLYDPAVPEFEAKPDGKFDGVISSDVLEHIEERNVAAFLDELFSYAKRFVFVTVCCRPAKKFLPDGRNCHLTVRPPEWWENMIIARASLSLPPVQTVIEFTP